MGKKNYITLSCNDFIKENIGYCLFVNIDKYLCNKIGKLYFL
jgi:hypothetical protein